MPHLTELHPVGCPCSCLRGIDFVYAVVLSPTGMLYAQIGVDWVK